MPKKVKFSVPKQFNINEEKMSSDELDEKINPYLVNKKNSDQQVVPSPKQLPQIDPSIPKNVRVGRPLRHIKYKPTKEITYVNNQIFPSFSYDKIKLPLKPNTMIVNIKYFAVNPIDLQVWNYYTSDLTGAKKGFGREFSGEVYEVADVMDSTINPAASTFEVGDKVCGLYYHLFRKGCSESHVLVDLNKDPVIKIDDLAYSIFSYQKLAGWSYNFVTAFQVLNSIQTGGLNSESTVLVNGGSTGTGLMTIQILKHYFHVNNIVAICSGTALDLVVKCGALVIIDYKKEFDIPKVLTSLLTNGKKTITDRHGNQVEVLYPDKKFDVIIDYIGGYKLIENHESLMSERNSTYLTTVGDKKANYRNDKEFVYGKPQAGNSLLTNYSRLNFMGINYKFVNFSYADPKAINGLLRTGLELIRQGQLQLKVNLVFKMSEIKKALDKLKTQHALGKILVEVDDF